jgi:hypothetical protein
MTASEMDNGRELQQLEEDLRRARAEEDPRATALLEFDLGERLLDGEQLERGLELLGHARARLAATGLISLSYEPEVDVWTLFDAPPGPAGLAVLALPGDAALSVDCADPARPTSLHLPGPAGDDAAQARALIQALVGGEAARLLTQPSRHQLRRLVSFERAEDPHWQALSRLALLDAVRAEDEEEEGPWPLWAAEAAALCANCPPATGLHARARAEAETAAETLALVAELALPEHVREQLLRIMLRR